MGVLARKRPEGKLLPSPGDRVAGRVGVVSRSIGISGGREGSSPDPTVRRSAVSEESDRHVRAELEFFRGDRLDPLGLCRRRRGADLLEHYLRKPPGLVVPALFGRHGNARQRPPRTKDHPFAGEDWAVRADINQVSADELQVAVGRGDGYLTMGGVSAVTAASGVEGEEVLPGHHGHHAVTNRLFQGGLELTQRLAGLRIVGKHLKTGIRTVRATIENRLGHEHVLLRGHRGG